MPVREENWRNMGKGNAKEVDGFSGRFEYSQVQYYGMSSLNCPEAATWMIPPQT